MVAVASCRSVSPRNQPISRLEIANCFPQQAPSQSAFAVETLALESGLVEKLPERKRQVAAAPNQFKGASNELSASFESRHVMKNSETDHQIEFLWLQPTRVAQEISEHDEAGSGGRLPRRQALRAGSGQYPASLQTDVVGGNAGFVEECGEPAIATPEIRNG